MFLAKILGRKVDRGRNPVLPAEQLQRALLRERSLTDRHGGQFSLLLFTARETDPARHALARLAGCLQERVRFTDDIGWLAADRIGVILPRTPARGAWKVAEDVLGRMAGEPACPLCTVYTYPSHPPHELPDPPWPIGLEEPPVAAPVPPVHAMDMLFTRPIPAMKRCMDVVGAIAGMVVLSPVFAAVAAAVRLSSPGPILFRQMRTGMGGKPFVMYKFRSMSADAEAKQGSLAGLNEQDGPAFKMTADPRVTRVGRVLRKTSLDELPQLWNVLKGQMSLVGPRPLPCDEAAQCRGWHRYRQDVRPGLTCIWQVHGRSRVSFTQWMRMDLRYICSQSFWLDLRLLVTTLPALLLRPGR